MKNNTHRTTINNINQWKGEFHPPSESPSSRMQLVILITNWREQMLASASGSFEWIYWLLLVPFFGGWPRRFIMLVVVELDVDVVFECFECRSFCFWCLFCSFSFICIRTNPSSVIFNPVLFVNRLTRGGFVFELIFLILLSFERVECSLLDELRRLE
jgi:hypothetical protein